MSWSGTSTTDIVIVTERERREPLLSLLEQLRRFGYGVHVIQRISHQTVSRVPMPQVVLVDVGSREFQMSGQAPTAAHSAWEYVPVLLIAGANEVQQIRFSPFLHDFITLPITPVELDARVRFALWKTQGSRASRELLQLDGLRMNLATYEVWVENRPIDLTYKEFELLKFFVTNRRRVFNRNELLEHVWESDYFGGTRTVDVHIRRLRAKLGAKIGNMIQTVRNVGYRFG